MMPLSIYTPQPDTAKTRVALFGGSGHYALIARGCSDEEIVHKKSIPFTEFGGSVDQKVYKNIRLGFKAQTTRDLKETSHLDENHKRVYTYSGRRGFIFSPFLSISFKYAGLGLSGNYTTNSLKVGEYTEDFKPHDRFGGGYLRLGPPSFYFRYSVFYDYPLYLNGMSTFGFGSNRIRNLNVWLGITSGEYDGSGFLLKGVYRMSRMLELNMTLRLGQSNGIRENAFGAGITFLMP